MAACAAVASTLAVSGCSEIETGWMPSTKDTTNQTGRIIDLWNGSWIAALAVGVLVWGLIIWCIVAYRRRRNETGLPAQVRYHLPIEILYTIVPMMMIGVLFFYTARDQAAIADTSETPDLTINVVGKQWAWDFNYINDVDNPDDDVYETSVQVQFGEGASAPQEEMPTLYLPVGERVEFAVNARDVIHSFWIPAFLYKMDMIPGITNTFQVIPQKEGVFTGKCAELCGEFHSEMLFQVRVVPRAEYDAHMDDLRSKGQTGTLESDLGRSDLINDDSEASEGDN